MSTLDATQIARLAVRVGLLTDAQVQQGWYAVGPDTDNAAGLVRALERKGLLTPWQSQKLLRGEPNGYFLGGYKLIYLISAGTFGQVFRAEHPDTGLVVAIKALRQRWSEDPKSTELFHREGKVGQALVHSNIVQILAVNQDPETGQHYMVMEFVEGGTLKDFLAVRKKLDSLMAIQLIEEAATGLAYAYSCGMTHRDIKPTNILISSQGVAKLVDFGLAELRSTQAAEPGGAEDGEPKVQRTVDYAALENATGVKPGDVRTDIYFLGCVLYEMLSGRPPLPEVKDSRQRMHKRRFERVQRLRPEDVKGPASLFQLVETMMALNPEQRYQAPKELLDAIIQVRADIEGDHAVRTVSARTVFLVEGHEKLRETIRDRLKEMGYKVLLSADPARALDRFQQAPFSAIILDAGTTGEEGVSIFQQIMSSSDMRRLGTAGILILSEHQSAWADRLHTWPRQAVLVRPVTIGQLQSKLQSLVPLPKVTQ